MSEVYQTFYVGLRSRKQGFLRLDERRKRLQTAESAPGEHLEHTESCEKMYGRFGALLVHVIADIDQVSKTRSGRAK